MNMEVVHRCTVLNCGHRQNETLGKGRDKCDKCGGLLIATPHIVFECGFIEGLKQPVELTDEIKHAVLKHTTQPLYANDPPADWEVDGQE